MKMRIMTRSVSIARGERILGFITSSIYWVFIEQLQGPGHNSGVPYIWPYKRHRLSPLKSRISQGNTNR
jgi:hypothetical protein